MKITATSESKCNEILRETTPYGSYWAAIRLIGWISQNKNTNKTTLYFKWQKGADNYWPYWNDYHSYSVTLGSQTVTDSFPLPQATNSWVDISSTKSITVEHNSSGAYSGTLAVTGYKYFEYFSQSVSIEFPTITTTSQKDQTDESIDEESDRNSSAEITNDITDSRFYIFCDGQIVYHPNDEEHIVTEPTLSISVNETDSLSFKIPPGNVMYSSIDKLRSNIEVRQGRDILFRGRVIDDTTDFNNIKSVNCEGVRAYFNDTVFPPFLKGTYKTAKAFFRAIIQQHWDQAGMEGAPNRRLKFVKCNIDKDIEVENDEYQTCTDALNQLYDAVGEGYFKIDYYEDGTTGISYLTSYGHTSKQDIVFGKNLLDVSVTVDATSIYTSVLPLGEKKDVYFQTSDTKKNPDKTYYVKETEKHQDFDDRDKPGYQKTREVYKQFSEEAFVSGTTYFEKGLSKRLRIDDGGAGYVEDESAIKKFGRIVHVETFDDVVDTDPDTWASVDYVRQLRQLGAVYLQAGLGADVTIEGRLIDIHVVDPTQEKLHVGDSVKILSVPHNLDGYYMLSSCNLPLQAPDQADYTFGATIRALTDN